MDLPYYKLELMKVLIVTIQRINPHYHIDQVIEEALERVGKLLSYTYNQYD